MSFALTTQQMHDRTKHVTRRLRWKDLKPMTYLLAVEKSQGLKKGEKVKPIHPIRTINVRREELRRLTDDPVYGAAEVRAEGFPDMTPAQFVEMFCRHNKCTPDDTVTRIVIVHQPGYVETRDGMNAPAHARKKDSTSDPATKARRRAKAALAKL